MTRMDQILEISTVNRLIRVQAGVITKDLQAKANSCHLYYPPNPTSADYCTIGGNIATNAGGASGVKYGVTSDYILGLTLVLADGRILETGGKCIKSVAGFNFKRALTVTSAKNQAERDTLWQARKGGTAALVRNAKFMQTLDFCVPVSQIAPGIRGLQKITKAHDLKMVLIGHAGDGNLHPMFIYDPEDPVQKKAFKRAEDEMCHFILSISGTLSGEHGIGIEKTNNLSWELSTVEMAIGRQLKSLLDPNHILNPGKCGF